MSLFSAFSLHLPFCPPFSLPLCLSLSISQGPHIASVTLAAYECGSVDFPEPPYPDQIVCPQQEQPGSETEQVGMEAEVLMGSTAVQGSISLWAIISKVRLEACMWVSACCTHKSNCRICTRLSFCKHFSWLSFGCSCNVAHSPQLYQYALKYCCSQVKMSYPIKTSFLGNKKAVLFQIDHHTFLNLSTGFNKVTEGGRKLN